MSVVDPVTGRSYAPVGRRVGAWLVDTAAVWLLTVLGSVLLGLGVGTERVVVIALGLVLLLLGVGYALVVLIGTGTRGQSPGKKLLGLVVLDAETGQPIGVLRALLRQLVLGLLSIANLVQVFLIGQHERRQGWHDMVARSVVLEGSAALPGAAPATAAPTPPAAAAPPSLATGAGPPPPGSMISPTPAPTGMIAPPPVVAPPPPATPAPEGFPEATRMRSPEPAGFPEATQVSARRSTPAVQIRWVLACATAPDLALEELVLAGRDPDVALVGGSVAWQLRDPELTVSKTHALFGLDDGAPWVEDWHSTNGVVLRRDGVDTELPPHERTPLRAGDEVLLGDFAVQVRQA